MKNSVKFKLGTITNNPKIIVDEAMFEVKSPGHEALRVSKHQLEICVFLAARPGVVRSRTEIMDHLSADNLNITERSIDSLIVRLRAKIGPNLIETVRGYGYAWSRAWPTEVVKRHDDAQGDSQTWHDPIGTPLQGGL